MTPKYNIGDLVMVYSPAFHGVMGIILRKRYKRDPQYQVKLMVDHDWTMWYQAKMLRKIK
jgi:hypothetical protein